VKILLINLLFVSILLSAVTPVVIAEEYIPGGYDEFGDSLWRLEPAEAVDSASCTESKPVVEKITDMGETDQKSIKLFKPEAVDSASCTESKPAVEKITDTGKTDQKSIKLPKPEAVDSASSTSEKEENDRPFANEKVRNISKFEKAVFCVLVAVFCYKFFTTPPIQKNLNQLKKGLFAYWTSQTSRV